MSAVVTEPFAAVLVARGQPAAGQADAGIAVIRHRYIGRGMREQLRLSNHGVDATTVSVELFCDADFANLFEVKERRVRPRRRERAARASGLTLTHEGRRGLRQVDICFSEAPDEPPHGLAQWTVHIEPGERWELCTEVLLTVGKSQIEPRFRCGADDVDAVPARRLAAWQAKLPSVETDNAVLSRTIRRSGQDLGALRIFDPDQPDTPILAAGAPWFMTVFGRDSLLTAWMTLIADPSLGQGVLDTLARFQGADVNPAREEEPGKILHEMRSGSAAGLPLRGADVYYGSVDATPLFVMLLGELYRWHMDDDAVQRLLPHADRALTWIEEFGDRDGDGYVEYERLTEHGLANQGWKDSWDAVRFGNGALARAPIALCEVQGYVYAAYVARAHFAREAGDERGYGEWAAKAARLRTRFNEDFWLDEHGWYALGLDADKRPVDALCSNMGHLLWTGIVDPERAAAVADRLLDPSLFSGWGVRTLATSMAAYNPVSYHNGSVWPHDNAICAAGLSRYGFADHAHRILEAQLAVADTAGGRLPELFAGFDRHEVPAPAPYPASCSPQAWAAAAPLLWLRTMLRLDPWTPRGHVWLDPQPPPSIRKLRVSGIMLGDRQLTVDVEDGMCSYELVGPPGLEVIEKPRPPLTSAAPAAGS